MKNFSLLLVDDEISFLRSMRRALWQKGFQNITIEQNPKNVLNIISENSFDAVLLDITMPGMTGIELLEKIKYQHPELPVVMITAHDEVKLAFKAIKLGAYDFIIKPAEIERIVLTLQRAFEQKILIKERNLLRKEKEAVNKKPEVFSDIITESKSMLKVFELVEIFAPTNETILITGETGTGKDLIAHKIHQLSPRKDKSFVIINIASLQPTLFESELFGHEKGAFTDARESKKGFFEAANGGTIFIDEIGELPYELQGKLLRFIQYGEIYRIGNTKPVQLDVRIVAATNKNLLESVNKKEFRADLYYRLNRGFISLPPLRERKEDISLLLNYFVTKGEILYNKKCKGFEQNIFNKLNSYSYPGNIRELENIVLNAVAKTGNNDFIKDVNINFDEKILTTLQPDLISIDEAVERHIQNVIAFTKGNVQKAAVILGVSERTLQRRLQQLREK